MSIIYRCQGRFACKEIVNLNVLGKDPCQKTRKFLVVTYRCGPASKFNIFTYRPISKLNMCTSRATTKLNKHNYELRWTTLGVYIVLMNEIDTSVFLHRYCIFESITSVVKNIATKLSIWLVFFFCASALGVNITGGSMT